jgi:hypothetical protein
MSDVPESSNDSNSSVHDDENGVSTAEQDEVYEDDGRSYFIRHCIDHQLFVDKMSTHMSDVPESSNEEEEDKGLRNLYSKPYSTCIYL